MSNQNYFIRIHFVCMNDTQCGWYNLYHNVCYKIFGTILITKHLYYIVDYLSVYLYTCISFFILSLGTYTSLKLHMFHLSIQLFKSQVKPDFVFASRGVRLCACWASIYLLYKCILSWMLLFHAFILSSW